MILLAYNIEKEDDLYHLNAKQASQLIFKRKVCAEKEEEVVKQAMQKAKCKKVKLPLHYVEYLCLYVKIPKVLYIPFYIGLFMENIGVSKDHIATVLHTVRCCPDLSGIPTGDVINWIEESILR